MSGTHRLEVRLCLPFRTHSRAEACGQGTGVSEGGPRTLDEGLRRQRWDFAGCSCNDDSHRNCQSSHRDANQWVGWEHLGREGEQLARLHRGSAGRVCMSAGTGVFTRAGTD